MKYPSPSTPPESFHDLVESFHHRGLYLEIELRQMHKLGIINKKQFFNKINKLDNMRKKVAEGSLLEAADSTNDRMAYETLSLSPEEHKLYKKSLVSHIIMLKKINKIIAFVLKKIHNTIQNGGLGIFNTLCLSSLRKKFLKYEALLAQQKHIKQDQSNFIAKIRGGIKFETDPLNSTKTTDIAKFVFKTLAKLDNKIICKHIKAQKIEGELQWKSRWLEFQEHKFNDRFTENVDL